MNRQFRNTNSAFFNNVFDNSYNMKFRPKPRNVITNTSSRTDNSDRYIPGGFVDEQSSEVKKDEKNRRIITREALYEDPDIFYDRYFGQPTISSEDWTQKHWKKATDSEADEPCSSRQNKGGNMARFQKSNKIQKKLDVMLKEPVKLSKAETMMQKMGWQGGALGRTGEGIVEPIKPNANYAVKTVGFGQNHYQPVKKMKTIDNNKNIFMMNVLLYILEFVKDDTEAELVFDRGLWKEERKWIHNMVNDVINADEAVDCDTVGQTDILQRIYEHNCYVLGTESEGKVPNRQLCLFKEATPNMFLITPADLADEIPEEEEEEGDGVTDKKDISKISDTVGKNQTNKAIMKNPDKGVNQSNSQTKKDTVKQLNSQTNKVNGKNPKELISNKGNEIPDMLKSLNSEISTVTDKDINNPLTNKTKETNTEETINGKNNDEVPNKKMNKPLDVTKNEISKEAEKNHNSKENETNPFLISLNQHVINNCKNESEDIKKVEEEKPVYDKIVDYFIEFCEDDSYTELRFLGSFSESDICDIDIFLDDMKQCIGGDYSSVSEKVAAAFKSNVFDVREDVNGFNVLYRAES